MNWIKVDNCIEITCILYFFAEDRHITSCSMQITKICKKVRLRSIVFYEGFEDMYIIHLYLCPITFLSVKIMNTSHTPTWLKTQTSLEFVGVVIVSGSSYCQHIHNWKYLQYIVPIFKWIISILKLVIPIFNWIIPTWIINSTIYLKILAIIWWYIYTHMY